MCTIQFSEFLKTFRILEINPPPGKSLYIPDFLVYRLKSFLSVTVHCIPYCHKEWNMTKELNMFTVLYREISRLWEKTVNEIHISLIWILTSLFFPGSIFKIMKMVGLWAWFWRNGWYTMHRTAMIGCTTTTTGFYKYTHRRVFVIIYKLVFLTFNRKKFTNLVVYNITDYDCAN